MIDVDFGIFSGVIESLHLTTSSFKLFMYEAYPESKDTKFFYPCTVFLIYKSDTVNELPLHNFILQHIRRRCPNIY